MDENKSEQEFFEVVTSSPSLKNKIHIDIKNSTDVIYWHIKFNIPLDEETVSEKTTGVTDKEGYILQTKIRYSRKSNLISIQPLEHYLQNEYYILSISKEVRSANFQNLKNDIHILFKLKNNVISEYKILPPNVKVPTPKKRPIPKQETKSRVYSFDKYKEKDTSDYLPFANIMINPIIGVIGCLVFIASLFLNNWIFILGGGIIAIIGILSIVQQVFSKRFRSNFTYNRGNRSFRKGNYEKAEKLFTKALNINPENEYAEYAKNKITYYLK